MPGAEVVEVTPRLLREWELPATGSSKYVRGRVVVVGGAARTPGAVRLAGEASLRVGAGHLSLAVAEPAAVTLAVALPEAGVTGLPVNDEGSILPGAIGRLEDAVARADAVVLGPGLDAPELTLEVVREILDGLGSDTRLVLDAFALGAVAQLGSLPEPVRSRAVLTPNDDEARLLLGRPPGDDFAGDVRRISAAYGCVVACGDIVAHPDGRRWRVSVGHSGLATSGSGDVLAGALGGLLARGAAPEQAACWAKYLHATAGERLAARVGRIGFLAGEILQELPSLLNELG